ncbi:MAG: glycine zipper 2TM domain-containing protein [Proteobacteria bacterium]|jgi:surface antigen|nr:RT0821/Lpp0805 family surface protein [Alphaproteobacteria bacterium]NCC03583.1 glycine zipper 2TM domain-containing protein [Pseudomonadota bacterium]
MFRKSMLGVVALALLLPACQAQNMGNKETFGTLGGAAVGGLLGSNIGKGSGRLAATAAGVVLGGWLGNEIGSSLDTADRSAMNQATYRAYSAPIGQQITWNNPQSGNAGTIVPVRDGYANDGAYCREFQQTITVGGQKQQAYGRACQQPDGSWKIVQ